MIFLQILATIANIADFCLYEKFSASKLVVQATQHVCFVYDARMACRLGLSWLLIASVILLPGTFLIT